MAVFIYFEHQIPCARGDLDDTADEVFAEYGEVTGGGCGLIGANIDLELTQLPNVPIVLEMAKQIFIQNECFVPGIRVSIEGVQHILK